MKSSATLVFGPVGTISLPPASLVKSTGLVPVGPLARFTSIVIWSARAVIASMPTNATDPLPFSDVKLFSWVVLGVAGGTCFISARPNSSTVMATPIAPSSSGASSSSMSPSPSSSCQYGPPTPTKALTLAAPIFSTETSVVVVAPSSVTNRLAPFSKAKLPLTWTN